jgi:hypothetical protein
MILVSKASLVTLNLLVYDLLASPSLASRISIIVLSVGSPPYLWLCGLAFCLALTNH